MSTLLDRSVAGRTLSLNLVGGFAILGLGFIVYGSIRDRIVNQGLRHGEFRAIDRGIVWTFTALLAVLAIVTIALSAENL